MFGVAMAPIIGRTIDRLVPWSATLVATCALLCTFALQTAAVGLNVSVVVLVTIGLDVFRQTQQVSLTTAVLGLDDSARSRLIAVLILALFIGQVMGTSVGAKVFTAHGWRPDAALNLAWTGWTLGVLFLRGPHCPRYKWIGWEGGFELRKSVVDARKRAAAAEKEKAAGADAADGGEVVEEDREKGRQSEEEAERERKSVKGENAV